MEDVILDRTLNWGTVNALPLTVKQWEKNHTIIRIQNEKPEGHTWLMTWKKNGEARWYEMPIEGNDFVITRTITKETGNYYLQLVELNEGGQKVRVSETIKVTVVVSVMDNSDGEEPVDKNIEFLYLKMLDDLTKFEADSAKAIEDFATSAEGAINEFVEDGTRLIDEFRTAGTGYVAQTAHNAQVAQESANSANLSANDAKESERQAKASATSAGNSATDASDSASTAIAKASEALTYRNQTYDKAQEFAESIDDINDRIDNIIDDDVTTLENTWSSAKIRNELDDITIPVFPNVTIIGQPTINNGQISNFSANNYCQFPFIVNFQNQPFELNFEITTGAEVTQQHNVFDSEFGLAFAVRNSRFVVAISTNGTNWNMGEGIGTHTVNPNSTYRVKMTWDLSNFVVSYSVDGGTSYITDITMPLTSQPYPKQILIGITSDKSTIFNGIINLNYASLTIANKLVWQGMDDVGLSTRMAIDMSNIDDAGIKKVKEIAREELNPDITRLDDRTTILWELQQGQTMDILTDSTAGDKVIPKGTVGSNVTNIGGMSRKCNQLINQYYSAGTRSGITFEGINESTIKFSGTATANVYSTAAFNISTTIESVMENGFLIKAGTYTCTAKFKNQIISDSVAVQILTTNGTSPVTSSTFGQMTSDNNYTKTITFTEDLYCCMRILITSGYTVDNEVYVMLNEGTTALPYEPYTNNLIHAKVDEVEVVGKNLVAELESGDLSTQTGEKINDILTINHTDYIKVEPNTEYYLSGGNPNGNTRIFYFDINKKITRTFLLSPTSETLFLTLSDEYYIRAKNTNLFNINELMIERNNTKTSYSPYKKETRPIQPAVLDLPDYGAGVNSASNEEDYANRVYHHRVGSITKRFITSTKDTSRLLWRLGEISGAKNTTTAPIAMCNGYTTVSLGVARGTIDKALTQYNEIFYIRDDSFTGQFDKELTIYYEKAEEEIIPLDDILPKDYLLFSDVEPNGQIKFNYEGKETYSIDVPNTVDHYRKLSDV